MTKRQKVQFDKKDFTVLIEDAKFLWTNRRKSSALLLLLCAVDALASEAYPQIKSGIERFQKSILERLPEGHVLGGMWVVVRGNRCFLKLERILYKYLRCAMVHNATRLTGKPASEFPVCIDWSDGANYVKGGGFDGPLILGGDLVFEMLLRVVERGIEGTKVRDVRVPSLLEGYAAMIHTHLAVGDKESEMLLTLKRTIAFCEENHGENLAKAKTGGVSISKLETAIAEMEEKGVPAECAELVKRLKTLLEG